MSNTKHEFKIRTRKIEKGGGVIESKPSLPPEGNESKIPTDRNKGRSSKHNKYRYKKTRNKAIPEPKSKTDFQGRFTDLEGYIFDLHPRSSDITSRTIKELE